MRGPLGEEPQPAYAPSPFVSACRRIYEIRGADRISYREVLEEYARQTRKSAPTLSLSAPDRSHRSPTCLRLARVLPERLKSGVALIEGLRYQALANDDAAHRDFGLEPLGVREAVASALAS